MAIEASLSKGVYLVPQALKRHWMPARPPLPFTRKVGPESRAQESSIGASKTSIFGPSTSCASARSCGLTTMVTGSNRAMVRATTP